MSGRADRQDDLSALAGSAVEAALAAGAEDAEAHVEDSVEREIRVFSGEVESLTEAGSRGVGVRTWLDGRTGFAYGTDLTADGLAALAGGAFEAAGASDPDEHAAAPRLNADAASELADDELLDPEVGAIPTAEKVALAVEVERAALADPRVVSAETTVYSDEHTRSALRSSRGLGGSYEASIAYAYVQAIAEDGGSRQTGLGFGLGRGPGALDAGAIGAEAAERSTRLLGAGKPPSRSCPVVLDETVAASFAGFIGGVLSADAVQRGRSPFAGRVGEEVASTAFALVDDGVDPDGIASAPIDAEGIPRGRTPLIAEGRLRGYLHDSYTARRQGSGARSTANAARVGYRSPPEVSPSNLVVAAGSHSLEELFAAVGDGVYVTHVAGLHSGVNPVSGRFSVGASGILISGGAPGAPASEFTIASDLVSMLSAVTAVGSQPRWVPFGGSVRTAPLLVGEMAVAGS